MYSCKDNIDTENVSPENSFTPSETGKFIKLDELNVWLPSNVDESIFDNTPKKFEDFLNNNYLSNQHSRTNSKIAWDNIGLDQINKILEKHIKKIPDLKDLFENQKGLNKIQKDIPEIKSMEDAYKNSETIAKYYNGILKSFTLQEIADLIKNSSKGRVAGRINGFEASLAANNQVAAYGWKQATDEAETFVIADFQNSSGCNQNGDGGNYNAYKHAVWNAVGVQEIMNWGFSKWTALDLTKKFACAHEYIVTNCIDCPSAYFDQNATNQQIVDAFKADNYYNVQGNLNQDTYSLMDLHNNLVGRTYMYDNVTPGFLGVGWRVPNDATIRNYFKDMAKNTTKCVPMPSSGITGISSAYTWYNVGDMLGAMNYHTPTKGKLYYISGICLVW